MPQGKGTYGSKVGRPPKKIKKYQGGGTPGAADALLSAKSEGQELKDISLQELSTTNAPDRNETSPIGEDVGTGYYKEGGNVDITDIVKRTNKMKSFQKKVEDIEQGKVYSFKGSEEGIKVYKGRKAHQKKKIKEMEKDILK